MAVAVPGIRIHQLRLFESFGHATRKAEDISTIIGNAHCSDDAGILIYLQDHTAIPLVIVASVLIRGPMNDSAFCRAARKPWLDQ